jgi:hypothetical protein
MLPPNRTRLALIEFNKKISAIKSTFEAPDNFRDRLIEHLEKTLGSYLQNTMAIAKEKPYHGGLNIEGIVKWDDMLLIGLRDPLTEDDHPIIIPLLNPIETVNKEADPVFGPPLILDTGPPGFDYKLVKWQPPARDKLSSPSKKDNQPILIDLRKNTKSFPDFKPIGISGASVPEGLSALDNGSGFIIVRDPEVFEIHDEVIFFSVNSDLIK